ncbi:MAG: GNAT family N-acetyltransferase [Lachnospiraceae bacterium]|nr:GNAT family N-acetyltransferase [Lachnospiraceae bacterium]
MIYRKATLLDCEKVYSLICALEEQELPFRKFSEIYCDQINSTRYYCLLAEIDNEILAVLNLRFEEQLHHSECIAEIMEFTVDSSYRNQGIGTQMLNRAAQIAESYGCAQIELTCNQRRTNAHRFYMRNGMNNSHYKFSKRLI